MAEIASLVATVIPPPSSLSRPLVSWLSDQLVQTASLTTVTRLNPPNTQQQRTVHSLHRRTKNKPLCFLKDSTHVLTHQRSQVSCQAALCSGELAVVPLY